VYPSAYRRQLPLYGASGFGGDLSHLLRAQHGARADQRSIAGVLHQLAQAEFGVGAVERHLEHAEAGAE
jgi:hypothetical protein